MFCIYCGKQIEDTARFCKYCGASTAIETEPIAAVAPTVDPVVVSAPVNNEAEVPAATPITEEALPVADTPSDAISSYSAEPLTEEAPDAIPIAEIENLTPPVPLAKPKKGKKKLWISLIAALLVFAIVLISVTLPDDDFKATNSDDAVSDSEEGGSSDDEDDNIAPLPDNGVRTIMIYIVGSDLESRYGAATADIDEMITAEYDAEKTQVVICAGGASSWQNNVVSSYETSYYQVTEDDLIEVKELSQNNMGDEDTLSDFLDWSVDNFPADRYSLVFWNHGGGPIHGYGQDELSGDVLSLEELTSALDASPFSSNDKLELLGFDACMMGSVETAWLFKDYADFFIASQEIEPGQGWDYNFLSDISSCRNGGEMGEVIIDSYFDYYEELFEEYPRQETEITLSCINLSKIDEVEEEINNLFSGVNDDVISGQFATASRCRSKSKAFGKMGTVSQYDLVDLKHIASLLSSTYSEAEALEEAVEKAVVYSKSNVKNANGLSIYHPYDNTYSFSSFKRVYNSFGFAEKYTDYIINFVDCLENGEQSQNSYREFSKTAGFATANGQKSDLSIQLTAEQMETFSNAKYYVFWEMPVSQTFSGKTEYLQVFSGQDVNVSSDGKLTATYNGKAVFGKNHATGKYSDCPLSMDQIYDGSLEEKYYFPCMFWFFGDNLDMDIENVNWLMKIKNGKPTLLNAYYMNSDSEFPDKMLINPDDYSIYGFMNNSYFIKTDSNQNTVFEASGSIYGFEYEKEAGFSLELKEITDKSQYKAVFLIEDIYGNTYFSDFISLS